MNRIICDICGSEYPETADRCPICSYPRQGTEALAAAAGDAARIKVKGGRFSTKNVRKRQKAQRKAAAVRKPRSNRPLVIVIVLLLIANLLVATYIGARFYRGMGAFQPGQTVATKPTTTAPPQTTAAPTVPCVGIALEDAVIAMDDPGQEYRLSVRLMPEDTTDAVSYSSSDPAVVTVTEDGVLTAMGTGQAVVTIACGSEQTSCTVVCWFRGETTAPAATTLPPETAAPVETTVATEPEPTEPAVLTLEPDDMSFFQVGESHTLRAKLGSSYVSRSKVIWTSSDPTVATVDNGTVTAVAPGTVTITAAYDGMEASCIVRCRFADTTWRATSTDVTITVGEMFQLSVVNNSGEVADVTWNMSHDGVVSVKGTAVTGLAPGTVKLTAEVDGVSVQCVVRVK